MKKRSWTTLLTLATTLAIPVCSAQTAFVNGASFSTGAVAPGSFATVFGTSLCSQTAVAQWLAPGQLPTALGGCSVTVNGEAAMLYFVSPGQVNFIVPKTTAAGAASVAIKDGAQSQTGTMVVKAGAPGVFALNGMGVGKGAFLHWLLWSTGPFSIATNGESTKLALYVTGLDLSQPPVVKIGGIEVKVLWYGEAPGLTGLQQINIELPSSMAGVGTVPITITSNGTTSNVTFMNLLPSTAMMASNPFWPLGKFIGENQRRGRETSAIAYAPAGTTGATVLVADEDDDVVRVVSLDTKKTVATITLPDGSEPDNVAVSADGKLAAVVLPEKGSVVFLDLAANKLLETVTVGNYPMHLAFTKDYLLVTNHASRSVSVIDLASRQVTKTISTGEGPAGIAANADVAIVANMQGGTLTRIDLKDFTTTTITLPDGARPHEVAITSGKAVVSMPMSNSCLVYDIQAGGITTIDTAASRAFGPRAIAVKDNLVFLANQMSASVTVVDLTQGKVVKTFPVDPGPRDLDVAGSQLLVLSQATGVIDVVDLSSYAITARIDAEETDRDGTWHLPVVVSLSPATGKVGSTVNLTVYGFNLDGVKGLEFHVIPEHGMKMGNTLDAAITVSNVKAASDGRQVSAVVTIADTAGPGLRTVKLVTNRGTVMGPIGLTLFAVTAK